MRAHVRDVHRERRAVGSTTTLAIRLLRAAGVAAPLLLLACVAACSGGDGEAPRATAKLVHTGPIEGCSGTVNPVACEGLHQFSVVDVRRDGDRIGVLVLLDGAQLVALWFGDEDLPHDPGMGSRPTKPTSSRVGPGFHACPRVPGSWITPSDDRGRTFRPSGVSGSVIDQGSWDAHTVGRRQSRKKWQV